MNLCRAHIGHTHLTHSYILRKYPPPQYEHCLCILTIRHILVECNHLDQTRKAIVGSRDVDSNHTWSLVFKTMPVLFSVLIHITVIILFCTALYTVITMWNFNALFYLNIHSYTIVWHPQQLMQFSCWGVVKHSFIHYLQLWNLSVPFKFFIKNVQHCCFNSELILGAFS